MVKLTKEVEEKVISLRKQGMGCRRIAEKVGASTTSVSRWIKKLGLESNFTPHEAACENCGVAFLKVQEHGKYCGQKCRNESKSREIECKQCKTVFRSRFNPAPEFCSPTCKSAYLDDERSRGKMVKPKLNKTCRFCNAAYETYSTVSRYCSRSCRLKFKSLSERVYYDIKCKECGRFFRTHLSSQLYCTVICRKRNENRAKGEKRMDLMKANGDIDWSISIERLLKRDGRLCYLCGETMEFGVDYNDDLYPNIEHVKPLAKGGTHTWDNVKLAHRFCNIRKAAEWEE